MDAARFFNAVSARASLARQLPAIQSVPGFVFAEQSAGTNGIGLALAERQLIRVYGAEHFAERSQGSACRPFPCATRSAGASRASCASGTRQPTRTRRWTP